MHRGVVLAVCVLVAALMGCTPATPAPTPTALEASPIALSVNGGVAGQTVRIGVVAAPVAGEGSQWRAAGEGAVVAQYRFGMGGTEIEIVTALDGGTADSVRRALADLNGQAVSGIVMLSAGPHVRQALLDNTSAAPVLVPYDPGATGPGVWATGSTATAQSAAIRSTLEQLGVSAPFVIAGEATATGSLPADPVAYAQGEALPKRIVESVEIGTSDSIVIAASAREQAALVTALSGRLGQRQVPIVVTGDALSPQFRQEIARSGLPSAPLIAVGTNTDDAVALTATDAGRRMSAFATANRLASGDPDCTDLFGDEPYATAALWADTASHDAVVSLVRAAEHAGSATPADVSSALAAMVVGPGDGLAGPTLDFTSPGALAAQDVVALHAAVQRLGLRPGENAATVHWFEV
ncbi:branched-chain amino acid ABC transporter substrate-binding protein [Propionicicella superfundia]|uniref:branched-chain amino acid ABC transporter substrate-binding protein n=1 Tax=Propionicicella superfundia TaxID=348582 RepID=UPI000427CE9A|nr:branched-chain amino acid ABC transporter substrate-binding protein [Propionicicella superfundia]